MNPRFTSTFRNFVKSSIETQKYSSTNIADSTKIQTEVKKTIIGNWIQYWKNVYRDYKSVTLDVVSQMKANPGKSSLKALALGSLGYCAYDNPSEENYFNELLENQLRLVIVPSSIRNRSSEEYIVKLERYQNLNCLRHQNFGIFSIVFNDDYAKHLEVYKKQCDYLNPSYLDYLRERIIDVGFLNYWYFMNKSMEDYDVNPEEWEDKVVDSST